MFIDLIIALFWLECQKKGVAASQRTNVRTASLSCYFFAFWIFGFAARFSAKFLAKILPKGLCYRYHDERAHLGSVRRLLPLVYVTIHCVPTFHAENPYTLYGSEIAEVKPNIFADWVLEVSQVSFV